MWELILQYGLPGLTALLVALVTARSALRRDTAAVSAAEADKLEALVTRVAGGMIDRLRERVTELEADVLRLNAHVVKLEDENSMLRSWARALVAQVIEMGGDPVQLDDIGDRRSP